MGTTDDPQGVLREIETYLRNNSIASITELERAIGVARNWLAGFLSCLEALEVVECKGTRTHKLYMLRKKQ